MLKSACFRSTRSHNYDGYGVASQISDHCQEACRCDTRLAIMRNETDKGFVLAEQPESIPPARHIQWDRITAVMAVLIGALALAVSAYTAYLQNAQVRAQTWPLLQLWHSSVHRTFSVSNRGVGPARVVDAKVYVDDQEVESFSEAFQRLSGRDKLPSSLQSYFARRVLAANEDVAMIQFETDADFDVFMDNRDRIDFDLCYCSVLDDCYRIDERAPSEQEYVRPVPSCPVGSPGKFR
jgi:hypothetical protein